MLPDVVIVVLVVALDGSSLLLPPVLHLRVGVHNLVRMRDLHQFLKTDLHQLLALLWFQSVVGAVPLPIEAFGDDLRIPRIFGRLVGLFRWQLLLFGAFTAAGRPRGLLPFVIIPAHF